VHPLQHHRVEPRRIRPQGRASNLPTYESPLCGPGYTIRAGAPRDLEAMVELTEEVFQDSFVRDVLLADPGFRFDDARLVFDAEGKLASTTFVIPREMRFEGVLLKLGGIGGVATDPLHRRKGYASAGLKDAIEHMVTQHYDLSFLYPFDPSYYARFGFGDLVLPFQVLELDGVVERSNGYLLREFEPRDTDALEAIYDEFNRFRVGPFERSSLYWRQYLAKNRPLHERLFVAELEDKVVAYMFLERIFHHWGEIDYKLKIGEVGSLDGHADALLSLCERAAGHAQGAGFERLYFDPVTDFHVPGAREPSEADIADYNNVKYRKMVRVVDLTSLLCKITPVWNARLESSGRKECWQDVFSLRRDRRDSRDRFELTLIASGSTLRADDEAFVKLLLGFEPFEQIEVGGKDGLTDGEKDALAAVFPATRPVFWDFDYL